jgi:hypothetical protein
MTDRELYLFDLMGFIVVDDVLSTAELGELNAHLDEYDLWRTKGTGRFTEVWNYGDDFFIVGPVHAWDEPFRRLVDHRRVLPYVLELVGPKPRLDIAQAVIMRRGQQPLPLHGGATPFRGAQSYHFKSGMPYNSLLGVSFALTDAAIGDGGFAAVPGSHKSNVACPNEFKTFAKVGRWVKQIPVRAGSIIIFSEALTHGTWPWQADRERRQLIYKYAPGAVAWNRDYPTTDDAPVTWSETAEQLLQPPWIGHASEPPRYRPAIQAKPV